MKAKTFTYFLPVTALLLASCNKKPSVSFTVSNKEPLIEQMVTFTNTTSGGASYVWDFGDGTSSTEQSPSHAYDKEGSYDVTLTVYTKKNKSWSSSSDKVIVQHPDALFRGMVNGTEMNIFDGVDNASAHYDVMESFSGGNRSVIYQAWVGGGSADHTMGIELGTLTIDQDSTLAATSPFFHNMIKVKEYYFSTGATDGIRIYYEAPNGVIWSTDAGLADQDGSKFIMTFNENRTGPDRERFKAHFNCKLYNGLGQSMTITGGVFELDFANI